MERVEVFYEQHGSTLTVWFGDPHDEFVCEETGDEVILMKDRDGRVIGVEKLQFAIPDGEQLGVDFDAVG